MTTFNVGGIWDAYLQGANFASQSLDRAEKAREEHKKKAAAEFGSRLYNLTTRVDPESGIPLFKNEQEIYNSPEFVDLLNNTELGREIINEGMPDNGYTAKIKRAIPVEGGGWAPEMGWYDDDGVEQSVGPMSIDPKTGKRSNSPDSKVIAPSLPGWLHVGLSKLGEYDSKFAASISDNIRVAGVNSSLAQLRGLPEDQRGPVVDRLMQIGVSPEQITHAMTVGLPVTKQNADGTVTEIKPGGSTTVRFDRDVAKVGDQVAAKATEQAIARQTGLTTGRLTDEENLFVRSSDLEKKQILSKAQGEVNALRATLNDRTQIRSAEDTARMTNELEWKEKNLNRLNQISSSQITSNAKATSEAGLANAPTDVATANIKAKGVDDFRKGLNAADGAAFDQGMALLGSANPADQQKGRQIVQSLTSDPAKADEFIRQKGAARTLMSALDSGFNNMTPEQVAQTVGANYDYMSKPEQESFQKGLMGGVKRGDPNAVAALEATMFPPTGSGGKSGKAPAAPVFKKDELKGYLKNRVPDDVADSAALNGEVKFRKAVDTLGALGLPIPKDSVGSAIVNRVVGNEFILQHNGVLSDSGVDDAFPALWSWEAVARETNPNDAEDPAKAQAYVRDVFLPITQELKASGLPSTFEKSHAVALDVARLQKVGLGEKDAIREAIKLEKDPKYAEEVLAASKRDKKSAYEIVKEWSKKDVRSLSSADLSGKRQTLSSPAMRGFSTLYPELNPR